MWNKKTASNLQSDDPYLVNQTLHQLYNSYYKLVCFIIAKFVSDNHDIEELANDVFISLYKNRHTLTETKNLKYYLATIAKNKALSFSNKTSEHITLNEELFGEYDLSVSASSEYEKIIQEMSSVLSNEEINIVLHHLIDGYTFKDMSAIYHRPMHTLKSIYRRSLIKFQNWRKKK